MKVRVEYDPALQGEVSVIFDDDGLVVTFGADEPSDTGNYGVLIYALRTAAMEGRA